MKMNEAAFLKTELGAELENLVKVWDDAISKCGKVIPGFSATPDHEKYAHYDSVCKYCQAQWEVYEIVFRQIFGKKYIWNETEECFGIMDPVDRHWLIRIDRKEV